MSRRADLRSALLRWLLCMFAAATVLLLVLLPVATVFVHALEHGVAAWLDALWSEESRRAIRLTLLAAAIAVPLNTIFGLCAAWLIARHRFALRGLLVALIDVPLGVPPVIAGLMLVLLFGRRGALRPLIDVLDIHVLFAVPGVVLATAFVTLPLVAREVLPALEAAGAGVEEAALTLGASGWQVFRHVTLPRIRHGLLQGIVLTNARAMGEFGAVSMVSGHIEGLTSTVPLEVEILYNDGDLIGAFALASLLALMALGTLALGRRLVRTGGQRA